MKKVLRFIVVLPFVALHFVLCVTAGVLTRFTNRATAFVGQTIYFIGSDEHRHGGIAVGSVSTPMMRVFNFVNGVANIAGGHPWRTPIRIVMIYCEAQGPGAHGDGDHVKRDPGGEEYGERDANMARCLRANDGTQIRCATCGAPIRRRLEVA